MAIELVTFGGLHILDDEDELDSLAGQRSRAALLVYLAVERRVSRETLMTVFWPESDSANARHALRQSLYHLKRALPSDWIESHAHELVVANGPKVDVHQFTQAIETGDLETAVRLYRGSFLDGVHLADLTSWESWIDLRRAQYARSFRKACRELIDRKISNGDIEGATRVAEQWAARSPLDDEAEHRLIEILAAAGARNDALQRYESYLKRIAAIDLSPSAAMVELGEKLRSQPATLPPLHVEGMAPPRLARHTRQRIPRSLVFAPLVIVIAAATLWAVNRNRVDATGTITRLAVLPFEIHGGESARYLREGMVNLLSQALDGAGSIRPSDVRGTLAAAAESQSPADIAKRMGASMYLAGDIVEVGRRLQIQASIYRLGEPEPSARASVSGSEDSVFSLADKLAARLLAELSHPDGTRLVRTASVTTSSLPAFKNYLAGDGFMRVGQFERAADSYQSAIASDSSFALAYYRLALAREWAPLPGEARAADSASRFSSRLSARDRNLLDAFRTWRSGKASDAERAYRDILVRYPDDVDAWFQLGEIRFHHGPLLGQPIEESEEAWRKVLHFERNNLFAVTHLARIAVMDGRLTALDSLLARFTENELRTDRRLMELNVLRAVERGDTAMAGNLAQTIGSWGDLAAWRVSVFLTAFTQHPERMRPMIHALAARNRSPALRADLLWFASLLDLASGKLHESQLVLSEAGNAERQEGVKRRRKEFDKVGEWYAATLPLPYADSTLARIRRGAEMLRFDKDADTFVHPDTDLGHAVQLEPLRQYTIGMLSIRLRDVKSAETAGARLAELAGSAPATSFTRDLNRGLRAHVAWARGATDSALRVLDELEYTDQQGDVAATPFAARAAERFLRGEILASSGRHREALNCFASLGDGSVSEIPLRALSHLRQSQLHATLNNPAEARAHYSRFRKLWGNADVALEIRVRDINRR